MDKSKTLKPACIAGAIWLLLCVPLSGHSQEELDAGGYLSYLGTQFTEVAESMMGYTSAVAHGKGARKVEKRRQELLLQVKEAERNVRRMKPFKGDTRLRDTVVSHFNISYHVLNEDYGKILDLEDIAEQSYDAMEAYLLAKERAQAKLDESGDRMEAEYNTFAAANNIRLVEGKSRLTEKMKIAAKVNAYYNQIYLLQFKSFKDEVYFLEAMSTGNVSGMEQSIAALKASTTNGLSALTRIPAYNGDPLIRNSCQELLRFYQRETVLHFPAFVDFEIKKATLQKMQKAVETKKSSEQTDEEINALNTAIKSYNDAANKVNQLANDRDKMISSLLNNWNTRSNEFLAKYTPRHR